MAKHPAPRRGPHTIWRDVRVATSRPRVTSAAGFAERLGRRRVRRGLAATAPDLVLLRSVAPELVTIVHRHERGGDRYEIRSYHRHERGGDRFTVGLHSTVPSPIVRTLRDRVEGRIGRSAEEARPAAPAAESTVVRILTRTTRREAPAGGGPMPTLGGVVGAAAPGLVVAGPRAAGVPMVVARRAAAGTSSGREAAASRPGPGPTPSRSPGPIRLDDLPPGEVNRLTDRVVRTLERRASAWRDRTGRA